jgi:hypothetical protein
LSEHIDTDNTRRVELSRVKMWYCSSVSQAVVLQYFQSHARAELFGGSVFSRLKSVSFRVDDGKHQ